MTGLGRMYIHTRNRGNPESQGDTPPQRARVDTYPGCVSTHTLLSSVVLQRDSRGEAEGWERTRLRPERDTRFHGVEVRDIVTRVQKTGVGDRDRHPEMVGYRPGWHGHLLVGTERDPHRRWGSHTLPQRRHPHWGMGTERPFRTQEKLDARPGIQSQGETCTAGDGHPEGGEEHTHTRSGRQVAAPPTGRGRQATEKGVGTGHTCPHIACTCRGVVGRRVCTPEGERQTWAGAHTVPRTMHTELTCTFSVCAPLQGWGDVSWCPVGLSRENQKLSRLLRGPDPPGHPQVTAPRRRPDLSPVTLIKGPNRHIAPSKLFFSEHNVHVIIPISRVLRVEFRVLGVPRL